MLQKDWHLKLYCFVCNYFMRRRRNNSRGKKFGKNLRIGLLPILLLFIFLSAFLILRSNIFTIRSIDVTSEKLGCVDNQKIKESAQILGQNIILVDFSKLEDLKKKFFCIKSIATSRSFPNKVYLYVLGREPAAVLISLKYDESTESGELKGFIEASPSADFRFSAGNSNGNFVVDNEGIIYSTNADQLNVPKVYMTQVNLNPGQKVKEELISNTLKILKMAKIFGININESKITMEDLLLINANPGIIFRLDGNTDSQIASLQLILEKAKIDGSSLEFIDLRFDKPIVKIAPKKNGQR